MSDEHSQLEQIFDAARRITDATQRSDYLNEACGGDTHLRAEVERLLAALPEIGSFLEGAPGSAGSAGGLETIMAARGRDAFTPSEQPGEMIGRYKLLQQIGEGGFGVVWMAEQSKPVRRQVALKIIKLGMDTRQVIARFEAERQALAMMDHPSIAKVLDAGATEAGRPFFVMELVKGMPITEYCNKHSTSFRDRLKLFVQVCGAVQHAHQKGIIHRDIKPSNVLVTHLDDKPTPKVIDFGIAKATQARLTEQTMFTEFGQFLGTPAYMSPEQADPIGQDIDTRSDIYSLGVLLYELLTGATPFDMRTLRAAGFDEIKRIIREQDPPRPSTRLSNLGAELDTVARQRALEPKKLGTILRGDLDWIIMKAMEKDRVRRYETANGLAMDIQRYLTGEAVLAAPPSVAYRARKFVRRNRGPVMAGVLVALAIILGSSLAVTGFIQARKQRDLAIVAEARAAVEARSATQISDFLVSMLKGVGPRVALGRDTTLLREVVDNTAERLEKELADQPTVASRLLRIMSDVYNQLAIYDKAEQTARRSVALLRGDPDSSPSAIARALIDVATVLESTGRYDEAKATFQEAYDMYCTAGAGRTEDALTALCGVGGVLYRVNDLKGAEPIFREALDGRRALANGKDAESLASSLDRLSLVLVQKHESLAEAEALTREALAMRRRLFGEIHPDVTLSLSNLASQLTRQKRFDEAIELHLQSIEQHRQLFGERHPRTASALMQLAETYQQAGRLSDALDVARLAVEIHTETLGADHRTTLNGNFSFGTMLSAAHDYSGAAEQYRALLAWGRANYAAGDNRTSAVMMLVANAVIKQGRLDEAEALYREALEARLANRPPGHPQITESRNALADCLVVQQRRAEAEALLVAVEQPTQASDASGAARSAALSRLVTFYSEWEAAEPGRGYDARAAEWKSKLDAMSDSQPTTTPRPSPPPP